MALTPIYAWSLQSPDTTVWVPSIDIAGVVTWTSGGGVITATPPVFRGATSDMIWTPSISNAGVITLTSGPEAGQFWAWKIDLNLVRWYFDVDSNGIASVNSIQSFEDLDDGIMIKNRVKETSTTTGTGTLDLAGAVSGFRTFVAGFGSGANCYYVIIDGTSWEIGRGIITSGSPDTLTRSTVLDSSASGAKLALSAGTKTVFNDAPTAFFKALQGLSLICAGR